MLETIRNFIPAWYRAWQLDARNRASLQRQFTALLTRDKYLENPQLSLQWQAWHEVPARSPFKNQLWPLLELKPRGEVAFVVREEEL